MLVVERKIFLKFGVWREIWLLCVCVCVSVSGERVLTFGCLVCVCVKRDTVAICVRVCVVQRKIWCVERVL